MRKSVLSAVLAVLIVMFATACNMTGMTVSEHADLVVRPQINSATTASIIPVTPTPTDLRFELWSNSEAKVKTTFTYAGSDAKYVLEDVPIGTYSLFVYGLDSEGREIMMGEDTFTVKPNSTNDCRVTLAFLSNGTGSLKVEITWNPSELSDSPISDAIKSGRLGFLGFFAEDGKTLKGGTVDDGESENLIKWVSDTSAGKFLYSEESVPATGDSGKDIYFIIYTKDKEGNVIALAKTFHTKVIIYNNLESVPDVNEVYNFKLDSSSIEGYMSNIASQSVKVEPDPESPKDTLIVTWENPVYSADVYPITVNVWLTDDSGRVVGSKQPFEYEDKAAAEAGGKATFVGLSSYSKYDVWFWVKGAIGYSQEEVKAEDVNPKIGVTAIAFPEGFAATYVAGQNVDIKPVFTPSTATDTSFTVTEKDSSENITIDGSKVTFDHAGTYTLIITSNDNHEASKELPVTVRLGKPKSVSAVANDTEILVSWKAVADADGYKITRTAEDGDTANFEVMGKIEYSDSAVFGGEKYTYSVQAIKDGDAAEALTGDSVSSSQVAVPIGGIQVVLPTVTMADFSNVLKDSIVGKYMVINDEEKNSIKIGFSGEVTDTKGNKATKYVWKLNGKELASGNYDEAGIFTLDYSNPMHQAEFHITSNDNANNTLKVEVQFASGNPLSATAQFRVLTGNPGTVVGITDEGGDSKVVYNSASDRTEKLTLDLSDNEIIPMISWSVADEDKAFVTVDGNGNVTALKMGTATVTATVLATGETASIDIISYVPAASIEIVDTGSENLIFPSNSVDILDESIYKRQLTLNVTAVNGETVPSDYFGKYSSVINWTSSDSEAVSVKDGYIEAKGKAANVVTVSAISSDNSMIYDKQNYSTVGLDLTVNEERTYGNRKLIKYALFDPPAHSVSLWSEFDCINSDNFNSKGFTSRWAITENWKAGVEPEDCISVQDTNSIYIRIDRVSDYSANIYRRSISNEPVVCCVISYNNIPIATVHFVAGYDISNKE